MGIARPDSSYDVVAEASDQGLMLGLTGRINRGRGILELSRPEIITSFAADPEPDSKTRTTLLYKEWRMQVPIRGSGIFDAVSSDAHMAELVLIGAGNSCPSPDAFTHWSLDVKGNGVDFRLFGPLVSEVSKRF